MMKRNLAISMFFMFLIGTQVKAQLTVDETLTPTELVNMFLGGGVTAFNITYNGIPAPGLPQEGSGTFESNGTALGLNSGIVLSTGYVADIPNPAFLESGTELGTGSDPDLEDIVGPFTNIYDVAVLEFDFVPNGNELTFRYVFASEEYPEWVCSEYNDAFGFFVSGPGLAGPFTNDAVNIAYLPGTMIPVTINTVNNGIVGINGSAFYCEELDPDWMDNTVFYVDNMTGPDIIYNGLTVVLEATVPVECGETYHIKIAVGDAGDHNLDSAVFLEAGSFSSPGDMSASLVPGIGVSGDTLTQGCPVDVIFERGGDVSAEAIVDISVGGTATPGVDYTPVFPDQIIFPAGEASVTLSFDVPIDGDPLETIIVTISGVLNCDGTTESDHTFYIDSAPPLEAELNDAALSCNAQLVLAPDVSGGVGAYDFLWSTGETTPSITVGPAVTTEYEVTITDGCSVEPVTVSAIVSIDAEPITMVVSPAIGIACGDEGEIEVLEVEGGDGQYSFQWTADGVVQGNTQVLTVQGGAETWYIVTVSDDCGASAMDSVLVTPLDPPPIVIEVSPETALPCDGQVTVSVTDAQGGDGVYAYEWTDQTGTILGSAAGITVDEIGWFIVTVTEGCGGSAQDSVLVVPMIDDPVIVVASDDVQVPCQQQETISVLNVSGGNGQYVLYEWSVDGVVIDQGATLQVEGGLPTWYVVTVTDGCGATGQDSVLVTALPGNDLVLTTSPDVILVCPGDTANFQIVNVDGAVGTVTYSWADANGQVLGTGNTVEVTSGVPQTITLTVTDECGNTGVAMVSTTLGITEPLQLTLPANMVICAGDSVDLFAAVTGGSGYYYIDWHDLDHTDPHLMVLPFTTTQYTVTVIDHCGTTATQQVTIQVEHVDVDIIERNQGLDDWYLQSVTSPQAMAWFWDMGDGTRYRGPEVVHSYMDLEEHWVTLQVITPNGCIGIDSILLRPPGQLYFPNAFTPDGDGHNDLFGAAGVYIEEFELLIFNRWGELIFESNDMEQWWDGTVNGTMAQTGVYVYRYRATGHLFPAVEGFGHITLLRGDMN